MAQKGTKGHECSLKYVNFPPDTFLYWGIILSPAIFSFQGICFTWAQFSHRCFIIFPGVFFYPKDTNLYLFAFFLKQVIFPSHLLQIHFSPDALSSHSTCKEKCLSLFCLLQIWLVQFSHNLVHKIEKTKYRSFEIFV